MQGISVELKKRDLKIYEGHDSTTPSPMVALNSIIHSHRNPQSLLHHLTPHLPFTLPLVRRLQFHHHSPHAQILSTIPPCRPTTTQISTLPFAAAYIDRSRAPETECWIFSSIELPSTASLSPVDEVPIAGGHEEVELAKQQLLVLLATIRALPLPPSFPNAQDSNLLLVGALHIRVLELLKGTPIVLSEGKRIISGRKTLTSNHDREATTLGNGTAGKGSTQGLGIGSNRNGESQPEQAEATKDAGTERRASGECMHESEGGREKHTGGVVRGHTVPYRKYIFAPSGTLGKGSTNDSDLDLDLDVGETIKDKELKLPPDLEWTIVHPEELALVISRTEIPRTEGTLGLLQSMGLRVRKRQPPCGEGNGDIEAEGSTGNGQLIAWAFLGPDGSLTSLHVEEGWRGRGLAKRVAGRLFELVGASDYVWPNGVGKGFWGVANGKEWCHSDVAADNRGSIRVAEGLGGVWKWNCFWCWIDLRSIEGGKAV